VTEGARLDGVRIGSAIVSYIEPHPGVARDFNRWYERDHFPAAVLAGPGAFSGARFVATRACKVARVAGSLFGDPRVGSYLSIAWLLPGTQAAWDAWVAGQMNALIDEGRMFAGRDHLHTAVYERAWDIAAADAPPAALALDRGYPGVVAIALTDARDVESWARELVGPEIPVVVGLRRERVLVSVNGSPEPHLLLLAFVADDTIGAFANYVGPALVQAPGTVGFAGPFLATVPGTDTYVDDL
jgi:hypothetical protein